MRLLILTAALGVMAWSTSPVRTWSTSLLEGPDDAHAVAAIELRCGSQTDALRAICAADLKRDFELGVLEPEAIVRLKCTQFSSDWSLEPRAPLSVCEKMYGGWIEG